MDSVLNAVAATRVSALIEIAALAAVIVTWVYFFNAPSAGIVLWSAFHFFVVVPILSSFVLTWQMRRAWERREKTSGYSSWHAVIEFANGGMAVVPLVVYIIALSDCSSPSFCADDPAGQKIVTFLLIVAGLVILAAIVGIVASLYIFFTMRDASNGKLVASAKMLKHALGRPYKPLNWP